MLNIKKYTNTDIGRVLIGFKQELIAIAGFSFVVNILMLAPTLYMLQVFDRVYLSRSNLTLYVLSLVTIFFFLLIAFSETLRTRLLVRSGVKFDLLINNRLFQAAFQERLKGGLHNPSQMFSHLTQLRQFLTGNGVFAFFDAPWTPIYVFACFFLHPILGWTTLIFSIILAVMAWYNQRITRNVNEEAVQDGQKESDYLQSKMRNAEVIESMGMLANLHKKWMAKHEQALSTNEHAHHISHQVQAITKFVQYTQQSLILGLGALLVIDGELRPGGMIAANFLVARALQPIQMIVMTWRQAFQAKQAFDGLNQLMVDNPPLQTRITRSPSVGELAIENLTVTAPGRQEPILKNISASFKTGDVVVILGPSGSGKSTLARSLLGIWPFVEGGRVTLDGEDIKLWDRNLLGQHIGYLPQDIELLDGTIAQNIARFTEIDSEKVIQAATAVGLQDVILRMPQGYDTPIGEAGRRLSGGQRQRLGLARAVYGEPMILVLDEPNANLDEIGEKALYQVVAQMRGQGKTIFLISHRPGAMQVADMVLVLNQGKIQAMGPKSQFINNLSQA